MLKKIGILLLALMLVCGISACNAKEKAAENAAEDIIENSTGGDVDVDIDGDEITIDIEGEDGGSMTIGSNDWPSGGAVDLIPVFHGGTIIATINSDDGASITLEEVTESDYEAYLEDLASYGFDQDIYTMSSEGMSMQSAADADGNSVAVYFYDEDNSMMIILSVYQ